MAACSCWVWMMEEPISFDFDMTGSVSEGNVLWRTGNKRETIDYYLMTTAYIHYR